MYTCIHVYNITQRHASYNVTPEFVKLHSLVQSFPVCHLKKRASIEYCEKTLVETNAETENTHTHKKRSSRFPFFFQERNGRIQSLSLSLKRALPLSSLQSNAKTFKTTTHHLTKDVLSIHLFPPPSFVLSRFPPQNSALIACYINVLQF